MFIPLWLVVISVTILITVIGLGILYCAVYARNLHHHHKIFLTKINQVTSTNYALSVHWTSQPVINIFYYMRSRTDLINEVLDGTVDESGYVDIEKAIDVLQYFGFENIKISRPAVAKVQLL
jgi:heme/copper-type cytochrome/quinol oxidase subunit 2